jgi:hypothetical protein
LTKNGLQSIIMQNDTNYPRPMKSQYSVRDLDPSIEGNEGHGICLEEIGIRFEGYHYCNTCRLCNEVLHDETIESRHQRKSEGCWGGGIGGFCEFDSKKKLKAHWNSQMCETNRKLLEYWLALHQYSLASGLPVFGYAVLTDRELIRVLTGDRDCPAVIRKNPSCGSLNSTPTHSLTPASSPPSSPRAGCDCDGTVCDKLNTEILDLINDDGLDWGFDKPINQPHTTVYIFNQEEESESDIE